MNEQATNQQRVAQAIEHHVLAFLRTRRIPGDQFHMSDLTSFVIECTEGFVAPDSPGRILRQLRKSGRVDVAMIDRSRSLYEVRSIA